MDPEPPLPWLKHFQTFDPQLYGNSNENMGDFVNNRCRKKESEPLWPENSQLIFYTRDRDLDSFHFYRYSMLRKKAAKFLNLNLRMPQNAWSAWFCAFEKYLFAYVKGESRSFLFCYDLERNAPKQWEMPFLNAKDGLCLYPTKNALYTDVCHPSENCRISYRHELKEVEGESKWEIVSDVDLPCEADEMYEFDINADSRAYDPRDHWEDDKDSDKIYIFNENNRKWEQILCSETTGEYRDIVDTYTPCLRAIYRSFHYHPEIFHPGPDTQASEIFACTEIEQNSGNEEYEEFVIRELYRGRIRPTSLKTLALECLLAKCPEMMDWEIEKLKNICIPTEICEMLDEHRNWDKREVVSFVVGPLEDLAEEDETEDDTEDGMDGF